MEPTSVASTVPSGTDSDPDLAPGTVVGEYHVEGKLGQGGFGAVFKAAHPLIGKLVAIKVLSTRFSADREMVSRFIAEAKAVNQIRHRNIIDIFSFGQLPDGRNYYVMEYIDGEPLDRRVARGPMSLPEAMPILRAIARALDAAHDKGIAHRDLKAENVFLGTDSDGAVYPKLLDFGIAKLMGPDDGIAHKTRTGAPMGTPYYMSPEQTRGRGVDHRTDLYAFGVLIYVMLTAKFPLDGDDYMTILMRQVTDEPPPASTYITGLPERVDQVIAWLMRKAPDERPPDLMTAVRALEEVVGDAPSEPQQARVEIPAHVSTPMLRTATTQPGSPASAATVAAGAATTQPPGLFPRKRRTRMLAIAGIAAVAIAVVAVIAIKSSGKEPAVGSAVAPPPADAASVATSADAAPAIAAAPVVAPDAAESPFVTITLPDAPAGAEVRLGGQLVGITPQLQIPRGKRAVILILSSDGYHPATVKLVPDRDQSNPIKLRARHGAVRPPHKGSGGSGAGSDPTDEILNFPNKPSKPS